MTFQIGDRVQIVNDGSNSLANVWFGRTGTLVEVDPDLADQYEYAVEVDEDASDEPLYVYGRELRNLQ